ncbi:RNA polymerase sigma factor [Mycoplasmatota bacterium]|nr:RNA polymerase sigma factor [Mycoplasmatota bacterium]
MAQRMSKRQLGIIKYKLKKKSERAFDELFYLTRDYLFYFIYSMVKNRAAADDLLQDTYITIYEKIDSCNSNNFLSWMLTIARNKTINFIRKESKMSYVESNRFDFMSSDCSSERELLLLKDMKSVLNNDEFQIVLMHVLGNYTHKQISKGLDKPIGTISWKYNEAMKKLKEKLEV